MNYEKIGKFISEKRKEKGLTQKDLATLIGVTDKAVSKWERGLGCPDVSILEILSECLNVSILEILKGRKIENEIIPITEANDYVKQTVEYSKLSNKNKLKEILSKIIMFLILLISVILFILNIIHIIYLNHKESYNFNSNNITEMKTKVTQIEKNIDIITNNQGIYNDDDYKKIIETLENEIKQIKKIPILKYTGIKNLTLNDLFLFYYYYPSSIDMLSISQVLFNYDSSINDYIYLYKDIFKMRIYNISNIDDTAYKISHYNHKIDSYSIQSIIYDYNYIISSYLYFTKLIIKVGDISE